MKSKRAAVLITAGVLCLAGALGLTVKNIFDEERAAESADVGVEELREIIPKKETEEQQLMPEPQEVVPTITLDDRDYIGVLDIPALGRTLPVQGEWSDALLKYSPCLYKGDLYDGMIIAGHNYSTHFSGIKRLNPGDSVVFTDADGNVFSYEVTEIETVGGYDIEKMEDGDWDLTLFTCTNKGKARAAVRCREIEE